MTRVIPLLSRLEERVREAVSHVALFPLVRALERALSPSVAIGSDEHAEHERVHFSHPPSLVLSAGEALEIACTTAPDGTPEATLSTCVLGLLGSESPLPPSMTEDVLFEDDDAVAAFYDVLHHRALALWYRAWKRFAPSLSLERPRDDLYARALLSLVGEDGFSTYSSSPQVDPMFALGLSDFTRCEPGFVDQRALEALLRRAFPDLDPRVLPSRPEVVAAAVEDRTCLGRHRSTLGGDAGYGGHALDAAGRIRIRVGPVDRGTYEALLPGGALYRKLQPLVDSWLASRAIGELDIVLPVEHAPALRFGTGYGATLGGDAQYHGASTRNVRVRVPLLGDGAIPEYEDEAPEEPELTDTIVAPADAEPEPSAGPNLWKAALTLLEGATLPSAVRNVLDAASQVAEAGRSDLAIDAVIRQLDDAISATVDSILHHPDLQALEARWRGLAYLVERIPPGENIGIDILPCSKEALAADLQESTELVRSQTFAHVYARELGTLGGKPYAALLADMEFDASSRDIALLRPLAALATIAHAPIFTSASPRLLQLGTWRDLPRMRSARFVFEGPARLPWNLLRETEDSRALGLLVGRVLHRAPYGPGDGDAPFAYTETVGAAGDELLFGSPVYVLGQRFAASFARHRTLAAIVGDDDGGAPAPATLSFPSLGAGHTRPPLEVTVTPRLERELRDVGLIAPVHRTSAPRIWLASANSLQEPKKFGGSEGGREATLNHLLGTKFPYFLLACRFAQYVKVLEREMVGAHTAPADVEQRLNDWLGRYVLKMNAASAAMRAQYPLRSAVVRVRAVEGSPGWHRGEIQLRPHLRYLDRFFTLSVVSWMPTTSGEFAPLARPAEAVSDEDEGAMGAT